MTIDEDVDDLATSWKKYVTSFYRDTTRLSLERAVKTSQSEGICDLSCIIVKVPIELDFASLIDYNPEFYDYFTTATPEELKGLIRESIVEMLQEISDMDCTIDKRQVSIEIYMKQLPPTFDAIVNTCDYYQHALPKLQSDNLELKGCWESHPLLLSRKIISISEAFYLTDIKSFACTNSRSRNNQKIIRHVGLNDQESKAELGPSELKQEVFINTQIKCQNCREDIHELYPFRSTIEFKLAKIKLHDTNSIFAVDALIVGKEIASKLQVSLDCTLIGFSKLSAELPDSLKRICSGKIRGHYFEVYGVELNHCNERCKEHFLRKCLDWLVDRTSHELRLPFLILVCQFIGALNGIHFNISLSGIGHEVMLIMCKLLNYYLGTDLAFGSLQSNMVSMANRKSKSLEMIQEEFPYQVNVFLRNSKQALSSAVKTKSFVYTDSSEVDISCPIRLSAACEAEIVLKSNAFILSHDDGYSFKNLVSEPVELEICALDSLQGYFLFLRSSGKAPLKSTLETLTNFTRIAAISRGQKQASLEDAKFAMMMHSLMMGHVEDYTNDSEDFMLMSPSISFETEEALHGSTDHSFDDLKRYFKLL